jgi:hypothetical protein
MRPGVTILAIPGAWYVTTELTGPAERGDQPKGVWTGLAGAELGIHPDDHVDSSVLAYLIDRFGGFDVIIAADRSWSAQHAEALAKARDARDAGDHLMARKHEQQASDIWVTVERNTQAVLVAMQRSGEPLADDRVPRSNGSVPVSLSHEWIVASFRHNTDDETADPLLHIHNVVVSITGSEWDALLPGNDTEGRPRLGPPHPRRGSLGGGHVPR